MSFVTLGNKIKKLIEYLAPDNIHTGRGLELYFLRAGRQYASFQYDESRCILLCRCWEISFTNYKVYDERVLEYPISEVGTRVYEELQAKALKKAEEEYEKFEKEERTKKIRNFLNTSLYGKGASFILED